jgi:hypothetical protein
MVTVYTHLKAPHKLWDTFALATVFAFGRLQSSLPKALESLFDRKEPLFHTKRRSDGDRESNPGHLRGRQRR